MVVVAKRPKLQGPSNNLRLARSSSCNNIFDMRREIERKLIFFFKSLSKQFINFPLWMLFNLDNPLIDHQSLVMLDLFGHLIAFTNYISMCFHYGFWSEYHVCLINSVMITSSFSGKSE